MVVEIGLRKKHDEDRKGLGLAVPSFDEIFFAPQRRRLFLLTYYLRS